MKRHLLLLVLVSGGLVGCNQAASESPPPPPPKVNVAQPIQMQIVTWNKYTGRMAAVKSVEVRARVSGYLQSIHFEEGQDVQEGDLLVIIDPRPFEAALSSAQAQLKKAEAELEAARSREDQAIAEKAQAEAQLTLAQQRRERAQRLASRNAASQDEAEEAASLLAQRRADVEAAEANIQSAKAAVETANAAIAVAKSAVENAQLDLGYTRIRAEISGRISNRRITAGNLINGGANGADVLTTIVALHPIHCYFDANEREVLEYMRLIQAGKQETARSGDYRNPVYMKLVDENGYPHEGHIDFVDNRIDPNTGTLRVRAIFPNTDGFLTPGMFAEVRLPGSLPHEATLIPDRAVGTDQSETFVYIVNDQNQIERRSVQLGSLRHGLRIVEDGLESGEQLVVSGLQAVRPEMTVNPVPTEIELQKEELPDEYHPIPKSEWLTVPPDPIPDGLKKSAPQSVVTSRGISRR